jgi:hypothetical protein
VRGFSVIFKHVLVAPASAILPASFLDTDEERNEPQLIGVDSSGNVWYYDQESNKWVPVK